MSQESTEKGEAAPERPRARAPYKRKGAGLKAARRLQSEAEDFEDEDELPPSAHVHVASTVAPARIRRRHIGIVLSILLLIALPVGLVAGYMTLFAKDQFASTTGFTIRKEETGSASEIVGGLAQIVSSGSTGNADLLFEYIQSQEIVEKVNARIDLYAHYSKDWGRDPVFSIWPGATIEDLRWFWRRMVRITFDRATGLIMIETRARDAETAREIARHIVLESETMINLLNDKARRDSMVNAQADLEDSVERLRSSREAMAAFRARTQILDPLADIQGRMGVLNNLQQQLAQALVDYDLLLQSADPNDPRSRQAKRRIEVIEQRIVQERQSFAAQDVTVDNTDYPQLLAQYESLRVDQEYAEQTYRAALTAVDSARSNAERQQLYLATYINPTLAQRAEYPQRLLIIALTLVFASLAWMISALVYYSLRDRG